MAIKIALANKKGGICKTTTSICLADAFTRRGKKVLLIDCDPQQSATGVYGAKVDDTETLADILYSDLDASECIQHCSLGDIIASDTILKDADTTIKADTDRFYHLADACQKVDGEYDIIIYDCPPGDGVILGNVLSCVDKVLMPITCDKFGIQGMSDFAEVMGAYTKRINPKLSIMGVVIVKYKGRQTLTQDLEDNTIPSLVGKMGTKVFNSKIRESVKCQEAQALGQSLYGYAPKCTTALDYEDLADEILKEI